MSQAASWGVSEAGPQGPTAHAVENNDSLDAALSQHSGTSRPAYAVAQTVWVDIVSGTEENAYFFDGTDDILIYTINPSANTITYAGLGTFAVENLSAVPAQTLAGKMSAADQEIERPKLKDYGEVINDIGSTGGGTQDVDLELGNVALLTVDTSANTLTISNWPASGIEGSVTLKITNGGSQTFNWPAAVDWAGGNPPALTVSGLDVIVLESNDAGTTIGGFVAGLDMS